MGVPRHLPGTEPAVFVDQPEPVPPALTIQFNGNDVFPDTTTNVVAGQQINLSVTAATGTIAEAACGCRNPDSISDYCLSNLELVPENSRKGTASHRNPIFAQYLS